MLTSKLSIILLLRYVININCGREADVKHVNDIKCLLN